MIKRLNPYPNKGTNLRQFLKTYKKKPGTSGAMTAKDRKSVNEGGLYYLAGDLPKAKREGIHEGFDEQVKVGAAGIKSNKKQDEDEDWNSKKATLPRNKLPGRLEMYAGHHGATPWRVLQIRNMAYGKEKRVNVNVSESEKAMKSKMKDLAKNHEGIKVTKEAYTYNVDKEKGEEQLTKGVVPEWYMVDWDKRNVPGPKDPNTYTPHQAIGQAMATHTMPKGHHSNQYEVNDSKLLPIAKHPGYKRVSKQKGAAKQEKIKMDLKRVREEALEALRKADEDLDKRRRRENTVAR